MLPVAGQLERSDLSLHLDQFMPNVSTRYTPAVVSPGADRRPLWKVMCDLGDRMGVEVLPRDVDGSQATDDDLLAPLADRSRSSFATVASERVHVDAEAAFGWVTDGVLPDGRWRLAPPELVAQLATVDDPAAMVLIPRRQVRHLNSQMADESVETDADVLIHPDDAAAIGLADGQPVRISAGSGTVVATANVDHVIAAGAVSLPHGFLEPNVGQLTDSDDGVDSLTGMPIQSGLPVTLEPASS